MKRVTRRSFIAAAATTGAATIAGCAPKVVEVEKIVRETVAVKETIVEEKIITPTPVAGPAPLPYKTVPKAKGRVRYWHCWGESRLRLMTDMIADFHRLYPEIVVESLLLPGGELPAKYLTAIAGGDPPEVMMLFSSDLARFVGGDAMVGLDELASRDGVDLNRYYPGELASRQFAGQLYLLPQVSALAKTMMFCNKQVMEETGTKVPSTWEELIDVSTKVVKVEGGKVVRNAVYPMYHPEPLDPPFASWLISNAGQMISDELDKMTFNSQEGLDAVEFMLELSDINTDRRPQDLLTTVVNEYNTLQRQAFAGGKLAFYIWGSFMFQIFDSLGMPYDAYEVAPIPKNGKNPDAKHSTGSEGGWGFGMPKLLKDTDAAWEWIKYSCYGPASGVFTKAQVRPNPIREYNEDPDLLENPHWKTMLDIMDQDIAYPVTEAWPRQRERIKDMSWNVLYHKQAPEEALETAWKDCQAELDKVAN